MTFAGAGRSGPIEIGLHAVDDDRVFAGGHLDHIQRDAEAEWEALGDRRAVFPAGVGEQLDVDLVALAITDLSLGELAAQSAPLAAGDNFHRDGRADAGLNLDVLDRHAGEIGEGENLRLAGDRFTRDWCTRDWRTILGRHFDGGYGTIVNVWHAIGTDDTEKRQRARAEHDRPADRNQQEHGAGGQDHRKGGFILFHNIPQRNET